MDGVGNNGSSVPLPLSWLRLRHKDGQPATNGGFVKKIHTCWGLDWGKCLPGTIKKTKECYQWSDVEDGSPLLPPDVYLNLDNGTDDNIESTETRILDHHTLREEYRTKLIIDKNDSDKKGNRRYVNGALHRELWLQSAVSAGHPTPLLYDQRIHGDITFIIRTRMSNGKPESISYV